MPLYAFLSHSNISIPSRDKFMSMTFVEKVTDTDNQRLQQNMFFVNLSLIQLWLSECSLEVTFVIDK